MGTSAAPCLHREATLPVFPSTTAHGLHERTRNDNRPDIRVIACPGGSKSHRPAHARAMFAARQAGVGQSAAAQPHPILAGVPFDLSRRERAKAACAGTLLAIISLAAAVL